MNTKPVLALTLSLLAIMTCLKCRGGLPQEVHKGDDIIVFQNVNLVPMTGEKIVKNQTVLVQKAALQTMSFTGEHESKRENSSARQYTHAGSSSEDI